MKVFAPFFSTLLICYSSLASSSHMNAEMGYRIWNTPSTDSREDSFNRLYEGPHNSQVYHFSLYNDFGLFLPNIKFRHTSLNASLIRYKKYDYVLFYRPINEDYIKLDLGVQWSQFANAQLIASQHNDPFKSRTVGMYSAIDLRIFQSDFDLFGEFNLDQIPFVNSHTTDAIPALEIERYENLTAGVNYVFDGQDFDTQLSIGYSLSYLQFTSPLDGMREAFVRGIYMGVSVAI